MADIIITQVLVENQLEDLGHDQIYFSVRATVDGEEHYGLPSLNDINKYCKTHLPHIANYLKRVRDSINGFGPKQTKMWDIMREEDFDIVSLLQQFFEANPIYLMPRAAQTRTVEQTEKLDEIVTTLAYHAGNMKNSNIRDIAFKDNLLEILSPKVFEYFPELFNSEPEYIRKTHDALIRHIIDLAEELDNLAYHAEKGD